ncbi:DUF1858 domain-containing protein [Streptococcus sobrinus]|mgnify:FL=1|uniref:DUF1858 domain-containing protein n=2 Tax=Streptococcus sobrinus TaxID=1310 RepID=U2J4J0_9STRE|nr:DUF1858 domain-containing protein [Streptococcus sobrinus]AWN20606.1 DUF1858 domain-containing protein [Streptococcus sobrinus]AWN61452.1 DUF1858 domain-containing protein [Streptococcus sobrinus]AWN63325.1 DUF1858 domain-containing protein [Streptococcus sobrinus]EMP72750.1 hypothetical protein D823_01520 [Streptococcus sobrinus DSM 20742 = ATCC 33478]ERJ74680.1 hypothetical protein HMPREF1557_01506 [Streptococcus sobrinus W1703]
MTNTIDLSRPVAEILEEHPELKDILLELGFKPLANPLMLKTLGRTTSLKAGSKLAKIPLEKIKQTLEFNGYEVKGD